MLKPSYYRSDNGKDLFDLFEDGMITKDQVIGFYKANIIKYVVRFEEKNGEEDLDKAITYLDRLRHVVHDSKKEDNPEPKKDCPSIIETSDL